MAFPLDVRFKLLAIASQISVRDASGALLYYAKQKAFKLKEAVTVVADEEQTRPLYRIAADRVFDISARYRIEDAGGAEIGVLQRDGATAGARVGPALLRVIKRQALLEGRFEIEAVSGEQVPDLALVSVLMMLLLERLRG